MEGKAAKYHFRVSEHADGQPWLSLEPMGDHIDILEKGILALNLKEGISLREAKEIAMFLNENIESLSYMLLK